MGRLVLASPPAPPYFVQHLKEALTGHPSSLDSMFYSRDWGDNVARGYLTVDPLVACHLLFPSDPGYFAVIATADNELLGEVTIIDPWNNFAHSEPAISLEASNVLFTPGYLTFWGRYPNAAFQDYREPLPTTFASTFFLTGEPFDSTDQIVWRERSSTLRSATPDYPSDMPFDKIAVTWFDEESHPFLSFVPPVLPGQPIISLVEYPEVTHLYTTTEISYPVSFGWQHSILQPVIPSFSDQGQAWMVLRSWKAGRYATSHAAIPLDSSCVASGNSSALAFDVTPSGGLASDPPRSMLFWADFEDGIDFWSEVVGYAP